jgi:hypothetical protein
LFTAFEYILSACACQRETITDADYGVFALAGAGDAETRMVHLIEDRLRHVVDIPPIPHRL